MDMTTARPAGPANGAAEGAPPRRQFVRYLFLKVDPRWRALPAATQAAHRAAFEAAATRFAGRMLIRAYSTVGTRGDVDLLLWQVSPELERFTELATALWSTPLGPYLTTPYAYLAMTRRSIYEIPEGDESDTNKSLTIEPGPAKFLFVYPFVKTRAWYALPFEERQALMNQHIVVGRKYPQVKLNTTYSFGLDDQEFVVAFETDDPADFLDLVMDLRETRASEFTLRDVPIFSCQAMSLRSALDALGTQGAYAAPSHLPAVLDETGHRAVMAPVDPEGWARALALSDLAPGTAEVAYAFDDAIAVFHSAMGELYAISNRCSHARGPLVDGRVEGCIVTCPFHEGQFDLRTGQALQAPATVDVPAYEVRVVAGSVQLRPRVPVPDLRATAPAADPAGG
jgi:chlorite dismutase